MPARDVRRDQLAMSDATSPRCPTRLARGVRRDEPLTDLAVDLRPGSTTTTTTTTTSTSTTTTTTTSPSTSTRTSTSTTTTTATSTSTRTSTTKTGGASVLPCPMTCRP